MKFTLSWLRDHLETDATLDEVVEKLTAIGLEVEAVSDPAAELSAFVVGHVVEARQHPNADRLRVCVVDIGGEQVQVICGAPNARTGMKGVFAPAGTHIPGTGLDLKKGKIRGEESNGMLCSERELGLSDEHEGIIELDGDADIGAPFAAIAGLDDPMIEIAITPNRQDCLGVHGIARDLAAAGLGTLKPFAAERIEGGYASPVGVHLDFTPETADACPCFAARYFRGVTNGPSPEWMQRRLRAIGLRPISALVDITNYVTFDIGRPLHVFDADGVEGDIHVRLSWSGETLLALDGKEYTLDDAITVVADEARAEGLGGVMGGEESGCTADTKNVILEVALFDPIRTATTGRKLGIESDARYRFERGLDPEMVLPGVDYATRLIRDLCGGEASHVVVAGSPEVPRIEVSFRPERTGKLTGLDVDAGRQREILAALGFDVARGEGAWRVTAPSWRCDVGGETDLIEEIARIVGFDSIPSVPLPRENGVARPSLTAAQLRVPWAKRTLAGRGLVECVTWSFLPRRQATLFGAGNEPLLLENPISSELDAMRPSLLANLLAATGRNMARGFEDVAIFEVGGQFHDTTPKGELSMASGVRRGRTHGRHWSGEGRAVDALDAKADALAVLAGLGAPVESLQVTREAPAWYHPGRSAALKLGPRRTLAYFGELHPGVLAELDVEGPAVAFEVFLDAVPPSKAGRSRGRAALDASDLPAVSRDFAFLVDEGVEAGQIMNAARKAEKALLEGVEVFDVYAGKGVEEGKKSVAISVRLRPRERTLTDAEIDEAGARIVAAVEKATGASLRG